MFLFSMPPFKIFFFNLFSAVTLWCVLMGLFCIFVFVFLLLFGVWRLSSVCGLMSFINLGKFLALSIMSSNIILLHSLSFLPGTAITCTSYLLTVSHILLTLFSLFSILFFPSMFQTKKLFISSFILSVFPSILFYIIVNNEIFVSIPTSR